MQLLVVRHGIAEDRETWAPRDDGLRPLTEDGKKKMKEAAKGLHSLVPKVDALASSPLTRAMQTAAILAKVYDKSEPVKVDALAPGQHPSTLAVWLRTQAARKVVAVVGHEPSLGTIISWLTAGIEQSFIELGKGGACLLNLGERIDAAEAMLEWVLRPSHLRSVAR
ncbi:MAG TPA: phosphoglycerate mutase family protein [Gemmatimonadales bacterium]|nr:phosphoglycerate mutase family protein [Gemmatimonadales bacterium]